MKKNRKMKAVATTLALLVLAAAVPLGAFAASGGAPPPEEDAGQAPVVSVEDPAAADLLDSLNAEAGLALPAAEEPLVAAGEEPDLNAAATLTHEVSFLDAEGEVLHSTEVEQGAALAEPENAPAAPEGSRFVGWFEQGATKPFEFEGSAVSGALKLYAVFEDIGPAEGDAESDGPAGDAPEDGAQAPDGVMPEDEAGAAAPENEDEHTVTFMANGEVWHTATVPTETLVDLPGDPETTGAAFVGWYTESGAPFNRFSLITGSMTLTAKFSDEAVLVTYLDTDGSVLEVLEGTVGEAAPLPARQPALGMGQAFSHWALLGGSEAFTDALTESITLVPVIEDVSLAVFVTNGSEVEPQSGKDGFTATRPSPAPSRPGYDFVGWSQDENSTEDDFDFATEIFGTQFIYAVWAPAETTYTLNIWVEKANASASANPVGGDRGGYELQYTTDLAGTTGDEVSFTDSQARAAAKGITGDAKDLLVYSTFAASEEKTLSAGGDTVINVFYTRTEFTFKFDVSAYKDGEIFLQDGSSVGKTYTISVKVEQDISGLWPGKVNLGKNVYFVNWSNYYGLNASTVSYSYISTAFSNPKGIVTPYYYDVTKPLRGEVTLKPTTSGNPYTETRYYYTELSAEELAAYEAAGKPDTLNGAPVRAWTASHPTYGGTRYYKLAVTSAVTNQNSSPGSYAKGWPGRDIPGYETVGTSAATPCTTTHFQEIVFNGGRDYSLNYFMPSKAYTLTLVMNSGALDNPDGRLNTANGGSTYTAALAYETPLDTLATAEVTRQNYAFEGWYLDENFTEPYVAGSLMPARNVTLYAQYTGTEVTVIYTDGEVVATRTYERGHVLSAHDLTGTAYEGYTNGDQVPGKGLLTGWFYEVGTGVKATVAFPLGLTLTRDEYVLTAQLDPGAFSVTFKGDEGGEDLATYAKQSVKAGSLNTLARSGHTTLVPPAREGFTFKGWSTTSGGAVDFTTATRITQDTTVYAVWAPVQVTLSFDANGGTITPEDLAFTMNYGQSLTSTDTAVPGEESVARDEHSFLGWFTQAEGGGGFDFGAPLKADTTVYAHWKAPGSPTPTTPGTTPEPTDPTDPTGPAAPTTPTPIPPVAPDPGPAVAAELDTILDEPTAQARLENQTGNPVTDILDGNVPLGTPDVLGAWSLLSLMMALAGLVISVPQFILIFRRKKNGEDEEAADDEAESGRAVKRSRLLKVLAIAAGLLTGILFLILDNMALPMVFVNKWTLWVAIPFVAQMLLLVAQLIKRRSEDEDDAPQGAEA